MESRVEKAKKLFESGCNCAQAMVGAYADLFNISFEDAMRASEFLGGGLGRLRRTCGAVTGMCMIASLKLSHGNPSEVDTRADVYAKVQELVSRFEEANGSSICADLLGESNPKDNSTTPEKRNAQYSKKRPCVECVADCARLVEEFLLNE